MQTLKKQNPFFLSMITILDCYTDEPSGLGVPPYLGTYPRYLYGYLLEQGMRDTELNYLTIDDLRLYKRYGGKRKDKSEEVKTNIRIYNLTKSPERAKEIVDATETFIIIF